MESGGDFCRRRFEFRKIPSRERPRLTLLPGLAEFILMVEMELDDTFIALVRRCDAVSIPAQHVAGETVYSLFRFHDFLVGRTPIRHFECVAVPLEVNFQIELIEAGIDSDIAADFAVLNESLDSLAGAERRPPHAVRSRTPLSAVVVA